MGKSSKKRPYSTEDDRKSKKKKTRNGVEEEEEDATGVLENVNGQNSSGEESTHEETAPKANKKKKGKTNGEESKQSDESLVQTEGEGNVAKRSSSKKSKPKSKNKAGKPLNTEKFEVEAIIKHSVGDFKRKYRVKLKNDSKVWISAQKLTSLCPDMLRNYTDDLKNGALVEAITSHKRDKYSNRKYLIKWKDHSKGSTWESARTTALYCSKMLQAYIAELEQEEAKAIEVEEIVSHRIVRRQSQYLIKWKDKSKGETWETAKRTITVCPDILDKFTEKNPDCVPRIYKIAPKYKSRAILPKTARKQKADAEEFDENEDWEVERILNVHIKKNHKSREFLIRWKGYGSEYDSWEPEKHLNSKKLIEEYMAERKNGKNKSPKKLRPLQKQTDRLVDQITIKKKSLGSRLSKRRHGKQT